MKIYDPRRIADNLRQMDDVGRGAAPEAEPASASKSGDNGSASSANPVDLAAERLQADDPAQGGEPAWRGGPTCFQHLHDELLPNAGSSMSINELPEGTRFTFFKKLLIRVLRVTGAKQADFNLHTWRALNVLTEAAEEQNGRLEALDSARLEHMGHIESLYAATGEMSSRVENATRALEDWVGKVVSEVQAKADAATTTADSARRDVVESAARNLEDLSGKTRQLFAQFQRELRRLDDRIAAAGGVAPASTSAPVTDGQAQGVRDQGTRSVSAGAVDSDCVRERCVSPDRAGAPPSAADNFSQDVAYDLYEDRWRGDPEAIRQAQMEYVELLRPHLERLPAERRLVLDVGFGRGEFLRALTDCGLPAKGVEINHVFVEEAAEAGLDVVEADALAWLAAQQESSLGAVVAFQVVEHLPPPVLRRFLDLVESRLAPGGVALFETLNPGSFSAYRWYFMDLSHERFIVPDTLRFLSECAGFEHVETRPIHPMADWERLAEAGDDATQANFRRLNDVVFGCQDYYMVLRRPNDEAEGVGE